MNTATISTAAVVFFSFMLWSCTGHADKKKANQHQTPLQYEIDIEECLKTRTDGSIHFSELFTEDVEYIPLETTSNSLIGGKRFGFSTVVTPTRIVADMKVFNRSDGKYIGNLSQSGQGPGEYSQVVLNIVADETRREFYFLDIGSNLFVYDYDCNFKYKIKTGSTFLYVLGGGNLLLPRTGGIGTNYCEYSVFNVDSRETLYSHHSSVVNTFDDLKRLKGVWTIDNVGGKPFTSIHCPNTHWQYDGKWYYYEFLTDSVFLLDEDFKPSVPVGIVNWESLKPSLEELMKPASQQKVWRCGIMAETSRYLILYANYEGVYNHIYYDKSSKQVKTYHNATHFDPKERKEKADLYINDLSFGDNFPPFYYRCTTGEPFKLEQPSDILESLSTNQDIKVSSATLQRLKLLTEDDNEVVVIFKMK